jgi:DNA-binding MarR family transcriptional regulator
MPQPGQLSVNDRVLLHLSRYASDSTPGEHPEECSQAGIASSIGISRTHVPRAVKSLAKDGLVEELRARVAGHERRMSVYSITSEGVRRAAELWEGLSRTVFTLRSPGKTEEVSVGEIEAMVGRRQAVALVARARAGVVEMAGRRRPAVRDLEDAPETEGFVGRKEELELMSSFLESDSDILVVLGNRGHGASALARRFADSLEDYNVLWIPLAQCGGARDIEDRMLSFARKALPEAGGPLDALEVADTVIVFDGYHSVPDDAVEFFSDMVGRLQEAKVVITAREDTPAYNWFYHRREVDSGKVQELRLKGLDKDSAKTLLGNPRIEAEAFRRILGMTRGSPNTLRMLRDRDFEGLKKSTVFTVEEIRYLLFLRDKAA